MSGPRRVEASLLVVEGFKKGDSEYRVGDRVPVAYRAIREVARQHPEWFRFEFETMPLDLDWLAEVHPRYEEEYAEAQRIRGTAEKRREQALRAELEAQERAKPSQREFERRYAKQEAERKQREAEVREARRPKSIRSPCAVD